MCNPKEVYLVTGSKKKAEEIINILKGKINVKVEDIDLPEYQGTPEEITVNKCKLAYKYINKPVFVEDTSLCFNAYNGLPGPYIKWFIKSIGAEGLFNMLMAYNDKTAYATTIIGYYDGATMPEPILFRGQVDGVIVEPRGSKEFGWDCVFQPNGHSKTFAEMDQEYKNTISHRYLSLKNLCVTVCKKNNTCFIKNDTF
ncbi:hypothetical protein FG379_001901 [Cryptosporidium bovis]|uniref:uncharacterized protein n=1 Tax=Cryptosporidium bovis TaxID=310047 RepID=UPI00351A3578|nr:hypothetical protein FG379_001901 [Cryptosporidium bovis]